MKICYNYIKINYLEIGVTKMIFRVKEDSFPGSRAAKKAELEILKSQVRLMDSLYGTAREMIAETFIAPGDQTIQEKRFANHEQYISNSFLPVKKTLSSLNGIAGKVKLGIAGQKERELIYFNRLARRATALQKEGVGKHLLTTKSLNKLAKFCLASNVDRQAVERKIANVKEVLLDSQIDFSKIARTVLLEEEPDKFRELRYVWYKIRRGREKTIEQRSH